MERLRRVAAHDLHQLPLGAASGHGDRDGRAAAAREPGLEDLAVGRLGGHEDPGRDVLALHVDLPEERPDELRAVEVLDAVDDPALAPRTRPPRTVKTWNAASRSSSARPTTSRSSGRTSTISWLSSARRAAWSWSRNRAACSYSSRPEASSIRLVEALEDRLRVAGQEVPERVHVAPVGLLRDPRGLRHARPGAAADVVVEARPPGARALVEEVVRARADREDAGERVERVPDRPRVPVRAEVPDLLALGPPEHLGSRPRLPDREREVRVGLVVAVADVEPGRCCWIRLNSSISASTSPEATIHSTPSAASTMASVRGWSGRDQ